MSISILIADDNPETREPLIALFETASKANPPLPPIPFVVYQTGEQDDVFGAWPPAEIRELKIIGPDGQLHASLNLNVDDPGTEDGGTKVTEALQAAAAVPVSDGAE